MSLQPILHSNLPSWNASKDDNVYSFGKSTPEGTSISEKRIHRIDIYVFNGIGNKRLEVHARTEHLETYLKIIDVAQNSFSDKSRYYFNSAYAHFPHDQNGLCTIERVREVCSRANNEWFNRTYLANSLVYMCRYETQDELSTQLTTALKILQEVDSAVGEIASSL